MWLSPFTPPVLNPEIIHIGDGQKFQVDKGNIVHDGHEVPGLHVQVVLKEVGGEGVPVVVEHVEEDLGPVNLLHETEDEVKLLEDRMMFEKRLGKEREKMWLSPFTPPVLNPEIIHIGDGQKFQVDRGNIVHGGHEVPGLHVQVVLKELGGEGVPVVVEHVEEDLGPVNPVHETEDEVYDRLIAMCDEGIAKVHWRDRYKTEIELVKIENKGVV